jgi:hypothetical protein
MKWYFIVYGFISIGIIEIFLRIYCAYFAHGACSYTLLFIWQSLRRVLFG